MEPAAAFAEAFSRNERRIARYIAQRGTRVAYNVLAGLELQAALEDMADYVRAKTTGLDDIEVEHYVRRGIEAARRATMTGTPADVRRAWAQVGQHAQVAREDRLHFDDREMSFEALRELGHGWYRWKARLDRRTCAFCALRHGTVWPISTPMLSHPNCRCVPVNPDASLVNGKDWLLRRAPSTLRRILGRRRAEMVEAGTDPEALMDMARRRPIPLRSLERR